MKIDFLPFKTYAPTEEELQEAKEWAEAEMPSFFRVFEEAEDAVKAREAAGKSVDPGADIDRES